MPAPPRRAAALLALLGLALGAAPRPAAAQPACVAGTVDSYVALGAGGCLLGALSFALPLVAAGDPFRGSFGLTPIARTIGGRSYVGVHVTPGPLLSLAVPNPSSVFGFALMLPFSASGGGVDRVRVDALDASAAATAPLGMIAAAGIAAGPLAFGSTGLQVAAIGGAPGVLRCYASALAGEPGLPCVDPEVAYDPLVGAGLELGVGSHLPPGTPPDGTGSAAVHSVDLLFRVDGATTTTPEPTTLALVAAGLLAAARRRVHA